MFDRIVCFIARSIFWLTDQLDRFYDLCAPYLLPLDAKLKQAGRWLYRKAQKGGAA